MFLVHLLLLTATALAPVHHLDAAFSPNTIDYDAYGPKIAMNRHLLVLAQNNYSPPIFAIQSAPYNHSHPASQCSIAYPNTSNTFMYSVAIGKQQNASDRHFFFAGEHTNEQSGVFMGMANLTSAECNRSVTYLQHYLGNYGHQEYSVLGVHPRGYRAYVFSVNYAAMLDVQDSTATRRQIWEGRTTWPDPTFTPHAVDISEAFGVVVGFVRDNRTTTAAKYSAVIYLIRFNSTDLRPYVVDQYEPVAVTGTWQDLLTNADANVYSAKYDMSVSIDGEGYVLVGMQFLNRVFFLSVSVGDTVRLQYISRFTNGRSIGNGKSVTWLDDGIAAVIVNVYTMNYVWSSSQVYVFDVRGQAYNSNSTPLSVFPSSHQPLPASFGAVFLNVVSSPSSMALLNEQGRILIFNPTAPAHYPFVDDEDLSPLVTVSRPCMPGAFKNRSGIHDCVLCRTGTKNPGNASKVCMPCANGSFCPLGSVADVSYSAFEPVNLVIPYPQSPGSTVFDEVLLYNMFSFKSADCFAKSPLFWILIVAAVVLTIIVVMGVLKRFVRNTRSKRIRHAMKRILTRTDLIGEGEFWVGGLLSLCIVVLAIFGFLFSASYYNQYPIENLSNTYFNCENSLINAKFDTNVQSSAIPLAPYEQKMFDLLKSQVFTLHLNFINTLINCDAISIEAQYGLTWSTIRWLDCNNSNAILTLSIRLSYQLISIRVYLEDTKTIGALRVGLSGDGQRNEKYTLQPLKFYQSFSKNESVLSHDAPISLIITKIINETKSIEGRDSTFGGIYVPTFTVDMDSLFMSNGQYVRSKATTQRLTVSISETPYYVKNLQQPIAQKSEIIFHDVLFTIACLEIFGLLFLVYKLGFRPLHNAVSRRRQRHESNAFSDILEVSTNSDKTANSFQLQNQPNADEYLSTIF